MAPPVRIVVVGGGHAGCEAAWAAARLGAAVTLVTASREAVARMSCNPAIGGVGKGHLVREVDALGGRMGKIADRTGLQFRWLNRSHGFAVRGPRLQSDKARYSTAMREELERRPNLAIVEGEAVAFHVERGRVNGVQLSDGSLLEGEGIVLTAGTFLRGVLHVGLESSPGGRVGESPAGELSRSLERLGLRLGRFKTGTPPRVHADSLDRARMEEQRGDDDSSPFHYRHRLRPWVPPLPQLSCWVTRTNEAVHDAVREGLDRSPLFTGRIEGTGPRYCPSLEDKVVRFASRDSHQVFVEPEGLDTPSTYLNGVSTSLPAEVQESFLRRIPGLERVEILRYGYAVEYDYVIPDQLDETLAARGLPGLFLAGQVNGTSGYEEAAAQGVVAGANAALAAQGREPLRVGRGEGYVGVLVDDLVRRGVDEPYRMFTSRAEFRLRLGCDSAVARLMPKAIAAGLLTDDDLRDAEEALERAGRLDRLADDLDRVELTPTRGNREALEAGGGESFGEIRTAWDLLRRPGTTLGQLAGILPAELAGRAGALSGEEREALEARARYAGYLPRLEEELRRMERDDRVAIPEGIEFHSLGGLSRECAEKLARVRPRTLGAASRIAGMTPAAVTRLRIEIERRRRGEASAE